MNVADVMDQIAQRLDTITGLRVFAYPPPKVTPPAAYLPYPESITYDATYGRGSDELAAGVVVVVGKVSERFCRDDLAAYADGAGARSVKAVLESGDYTAFDTVRVSEVTFDVLPIAGVDYLAAMFELQIAGPGSS